MESFIVTVGAREWDESLPDTRFRGPAERDDVVILGG
jgi:hypothetical protein